MIIFNFFDLLKKHCFTLTQCYFFQSLFLPREHPKRDLANNSDLLLEHIVPQKLLSVIWLSTTNKNQE
jgi:hypothetical protein